jgi:voltage-gated potassium channel
VFTLDRGGLRDSDGQVSFADIVYFTFITVTSVGYGDIVPVTTTARLIDALFVTPVRLFIWVIFLGTAYQFVAQKIIEEFRMRLRQSQLTGHVVICGYGLSGRSTAAELLRRGENPAHIVVIDRSEDALLEAAEVAWWACAAMRPVSCSPTQTSTRREQPSFASGDDTSVLYADDARLDLRIVAMVRRRRTNSFATRRRIGDDLSVDVSGILMANSTSASSGRELRVTC